MRVEQFRITNNGRGYKIAKSEDVDSWLSRESYHRVAFQKTRRNIQSAETETWLDKDGIYARSVISQGTDDLQRETFQNHTLLIRYRDLAQLAVKGLAFDSLLHAQIDPAAKVLPSLSL